MTNLRIETQRIDAVNRRIDALRTASASSDLELVQTVTETTYPTSTGAFFAVETLGIDGSEYEGAFASFAPDPARIFYAYNLGTQIPPPGTRLVVAWVDGRAVFRYDG